MDIPEKLGIKDTDFRLVFGSSNIDYDPKKNEKKIAEHGYSFDNVAEIFQNYLLPMLNLPPFITKDSIIKNDELRSNVLALDKEGKVVLIALTMRQGETVRIISMRLASRKERELFREHTGYNKPLERDV